MKHGHAIVIVTVIITAACISVQMSVRDKAYERGYGDGFTDMKHLSKSAQDYRWYVTLANNETNTSYSEYLDEVTYPDGRPLAAPYRNDPVAYCLYYVEGYLTPIRDKEFTCTYSGSTGHLGVTWTEHFIARPKVYP